MSRASLLDRTLYLSRVGREHRPANERDLQIEIDKQGFVSFDGTCVSLLSQIALFSSVRQLIGVHGAAFADIV